MIQVLENPKTENYLALKEFILSEQFPWFFLKYSTPKLNMDGYDNPPVYSHIFLSRPESNGFKYPKQQSTYLDSVTRVIKEILLHNDIDVYTFLRINANMMLPSNELQKTVPHYDHRYKHKNFLMYLTDAGGDTIVENERHSPQEDDVIIFDGLHYLETSKKERRIVIVATFLDETTNPVYG